MSLDRSNKDRRVVHCNILLYLGKILFPKESRGSTLGRAIFALDHMYPLLQGRKIHFMGVKSNFSTIENAFIAWKNSLQIVNALSTTAKMHFSNEANVFRRRMAIAGQVQSLRRPFRRGHRYVLLQGREMRFHGEEKYVLTTGKCIFAVAETALRIRNALAR